MNEKEVDIAFRPAVSACSRTKDARIDRTWIPRSQFLSKAIPQNVPQVRKDVGYWGCKVLSVELMNCVPSNERGPHDALVNQASQTLSDPELGASNGLCGNFSNSQRAPCCS